MTAFSRQQLDVGENVLSLELRSVNHRYLDLSFKLPDNLRQLEPAWRDRCKSQLARGRIDIFLRCSGSDSTGTALQLDHEIIGELNKAIKEVSAAIPNSAGVSSLDVLRWPGVVQDTDASDPEALQIAANRLFDQTLSALVASRTREGELLRSILEAKLGEAATIVQQCRTALPELLNTQQQRLRERLGELEVDLDEGRLEQEITILANKADVAEELDRLDIHLGEIRRVLAEGGACGRRLDFLMQELNREANTLASKSVAAASTLNAVDLKVLIEQMREQIQNIE